MGRRPWTTRKQRQWLNEKRRAYAEAQERKQLPIFYKEVIAEFFKAFELRISNAGGDQMDGRMGSYDGDGDDWSEHEDVCFASSELLARNVSKRMKREQ